MPTARGGIATAVIGTTIYTTPSGRADGERYGSYVATSYCVAGHLKSGARPFRGCRRLR